MQLPSQLFENSDYQKVIDKVNKVRSYGLNRELAIPQIAIVGDQSTGKSSVLEAVTKLSFPRDKNTCTRFATQVSLRQDTSSKEDKLSAYIDGEDDFNKKYEVIQPPLTFEGAIKEAVEVLCYDSDISDKVLEITLSGPTQSPLTIIDLPGFIKTTVDGQDKRLPEKIRAINLRYIQSTRTIILAAHPATNDLNNSTALAEAEAVDPKGERTIPIITKPDEVSEGLLEDVVEMVLNRRKHMKLGYLVLKNSAYSDRSLPWEVAREREKLYFEQSPLWKTVPDNVKGRDSARRFLGTLLHAHILKELPLVKKEIITHIDNVQRELLAMGTQILDTRGARVAYTVIATKLKESLDSLFSGKYAPEYISEFKDNESIIDIGAETPVGIRFIRSTLHRMYDEYDTSMTDNTNIPSVQEISALALRYKGDELPGFLSFGIFRQIFSETLSSWKSTTVSHIDRICHYLQVAITSYIEHAVESIVQPVVLDVFHTFYRDQKMLVEKDLEAIFDDETHPFTLNKGYAQEIRRLRETVPSDNESDGASNSIFSRKSRKPWSQSTESRLESNDWVTAKDMKEILGAYGEIARLRIVDVVLMQTVERHLTRRIDTLFKSLIAVDDSALECLYESEQKKAHRISLERKLQILRNSYKEL
ncbi:hypothetical protein BGW42_005400 [Actinomortierella wolfii]|nr:hypothetical protein BGW42_005400 [Actinomortierella wolfii]